MVSVRGTKGVNDDDDMSGINSDMNSVNGDGTNGVRSDMHCVNDDMSGVSSDMNDVNDNMSVIRMWHERCQ